MDQKLGQLFFIGIQGKELLPEEATFIANNNIGGVILFTRNVENPKQLHGLCSEIQSLHHKQSSKAPLFMGIDMEGGRVQRLAAPFTQWPPMRKLGDLDSTSMAFKFTMSMGQELKAVGINLNFAPCVDILTNEANTVIGDRAIGTDPEQVAKMASALVRGFIKAEIIPCAKHFPGHGNTLIDSHDDLPEDDTDLDTLMSRELVPFKKSFRARLDMVMTAHIKFTNIDPEWPVTLSPKFIKEIIRQEMRYKNLVITDDLDMGALKKNYEVEEIATQALVADCDILLYCNEPDSPPRGLEAIKKAISDGKIDKAAIENKYERILALKKAKIKQVDPLDFDEVSRMVGHPDHLKLSKAIEEGKIPEDLQT